MTGMLYSVQIVLASVSRSAFLPSFLAWLMIFWVWFIVYPSVGAFVYVMCCGFKNGLLFVQVFFVVCIFVLQIDNTV